MPKKTAKKGLRADAERNRRVLLETAQEIFASEGLGVPVDEIARRAGVGVATLYRHFPAKEDLFEAILVDRMERVAERAEDLADAPEPSVALFEMLGVIAAESAKKKDFIHALGGSLKAKDVLDAAKKRFRAALDELLSRAQRSKSVRADVSTADLLALLHGVLSIPDASAEARKRHLAVLFDGLAHEGRKPTTYRQARR